MDPCSNQSSRRVGSLSHGHLDRGGWMTTAGLFFNKMSRRSRSFAPGRAAARPRRPRCRWRGVSATWMKRLPSQRAPPALSKASPTAARSVAELKKMAKKWGLFLIPVLTFPSR